MNKSRNKRRISRRKFLEGTGAALVVAAEAPSLAGQEKAAPPGPHTSIRITVNGKTHRLPVEDRWTLVEVLRDHLMLTGTKIGCDRGECGACTVLIDDVAHYSCSTLTHTVRNAAITTIEGLEGANGELHPVQQAMIDELGPQCGFCTPGQILSAVALLKVNPKPTRDEARHAMSGNLCRCGAYDNYLNAVLRAAGSA
jgi:aerobic-type carbon monoxide dehydrogenase small subunit (CoxS/CutS family)